MPALSCEPRAVLAVAVLLGLASNACGDDFSLADHGAAGRDAADAAQLTGGAGGTGGRDAAVARDAAPADAADSDRRTADSGSEDTSTEPPIPTQGLLLWLRADRGVTLESGFVTRWADQSANHSDAVAVSVDTRPELVSAGIGNRPSLKFDGADDFLQMPAGFSDFSRGLSVFASVERATADPCSAVLELSNGSEIDDISFGQFQNQLLYEVYDYSASHGVLPLATPLLLAIVHRPDLTYEARQNRKMIGEGSQPLPASITREQNFVGKTLYGNCGLFPGMITELIVYDRSLSDSEVLAVEASMSAHAGCCEP